MKSRWSHHRNLSVPIQPGWIIALSLASVFAQPVVAATQYWDPGFTPAANGGTGSGGAGTWATATANWSNGATDAALTITNVADFSGAAGGAVSLTSAVVTGGLKFDVSNYSIAGSGGQISITPQASTDGLIVTSGVTGTSISVDSIKLASPASGTNIQLTNTDLVNFNNTTVYLSGNRVTNLVNSSTSGTTTIAKFGASDKPNGGTGVLATVNVNQGNLVINSLGAAANANGTLSAYNETTTTVRSTNLTIGGTGVNATGTVTINGNNTLFNNGITPQANTAVGLTFNMANGTLALGHDNALGARNASNALTTTSLTMSGGTLLASGGARIVENKMTISGNIGIGGANNLSLVNDVTNSGGNRIVTVGNSSLTTLSGAVNLANDNITARSLTIGGTGNVAISGAIANNSAGNTVASGLTKSGTGTLTLSGTNTYTGNTTLNSGSLLTLNNAGSMKFVIGAVGVNNKVTGAGSATLNGTFNIDVSGAGVPASGSVWTLVDAGKSFGASFAVAGFTESPAGGGLWVNGSWYFSELSGKLSYGVPPDLYWDGDSGGAWSVGGNWVGGAAPVSGDTPVFTGANTTNNNDLNTATAGTVALGGIIFGPAASSFNLNGNAVNLSGKTIANYSSSAQTLAFDIEADNGFTVDTSAGSVTITGSLKTTSGFNKLLAKNGTGTLILNGTQNTSWNLQVNAGVVQDFNANAGGQVTAFSCTIAAGATLISESGDILHAALPLLNNGTYDIGASGEALGDLNGSGVVTNHGASSAVTCLLQLGRGNGVFSGSIQDGPSGSPTAVTIFEAFPNDVPDYTHTFSGNNTYTGNTTISQADQSFALSSTGAMKFKIGANGVNNRITGVAQTLGTVSLDGTFNFDLTGAAISNGYSWQIVAANLIPTTTFGGSFNVPGFTQASNVWTKVDGSNTWTFTEGTGVLSLSVSGGSGYGTWASANGIPGQPALEDFDKDGLSNLVEYALGKSPTASSTPAGTLSGSVVSFTKGADAVANGDVTWAIEESDDLGISDPWSTVTPTDNNPSTISYTLPPERPKVFARLVVRQIP